MININNLAVKFDNITILNNVSLAINKGELVHVLGPNGGGKTTLIKAILGLIKPQSGSITINTTKIGYLAQVNNVKKNFPSTVYEVIYSGFDKQTLLPNKHDLALMNEWLKDMNLEGFGKKQFFELSGGERQRVLLIKALIANPELLILDEPTTALDPNFRQKFYQLIQNFNAQGTTIIDITHDLTISNLNCDHKVLFLDREIKFFGRYCDYHQQFGGRDAHVH